ncbi:hypothetical protein Q2433_19215, partial [Escherichia coli]|nr:hypothetical protein [Escherichia coli]
CYYFFFQAEAGKRINAWFLGLGDFNKRQLRIRIFECPHRLSDKLLKSSAASLFLSGAGCA